MATDSDQALLDRRLIEAGLEGRRAAHDRLRAKGFARVWAQADRAGPMSALELARFLLRRLYPDLEGPRLEAIMARLEAEWHAGTWTGFARPDPDESLSRGARRPTPSDDPIDSRQPPRR